MRAVVAFDQLKPEFRACVMIGLWNVLPRRPDLAFRFTVHGQHALECRGACQKGL